MKLQKKKKPYKIENGGLFNTERIVLFLFCIALSELYCNEAFQRFEFPRIFIKQKCRNLKLLNKEEAASCMQALLCGT